MSTEGPQRNAAGTRANDRRGRWITGLVSTVSLVLAILALLLSQLNPDAAATNSSTPCPTATIARAVDGLSAYDLWLSVGNKGTLDDFLTSLVGEQGPAGADGESIYLGNPGFAGPAGDHGHEGASAYQLWLDAGNDGTAEEFLASLEGAGGTEGPSAYDVWVAIGNTGQSEQDFIDFLVGEQGPVGPSGAPGETGQSAYDIWLSIPGNTGDEVAFVNSLIGAKGEPGIPGTCTIGETGAQGPEGPTGPQGEIGPTGPAGAQGPQGDKGDKGDTGPAGPATYGHAGSFFDLTVQGWDSPDSVSRGVNTAFPVYFSDSDPAVTDGITVTHGSGDATGHDSFITFTHPGIYNIAFSAQLYRSQGGSTVDTSFWLRKNGSNVPATNTDVTLQAGAGKLVAAWNFFVPVTCSTTLGVTTCDNYQLMWSYTNQNVNIWYQPAQTNPARPEIPSVILTVNQVQ